MKAEKVVNPPKNPKTIKDLNSLLNNCFSIREATIPIKKDPIKFTITVPIGKLIKVIFLLCYYYFFSFYSRWAPVEGLTSGRSRRRRNV